MKVLLLITGLGYGGAEAQLGRVATRLKARGWEVRVISLMPSRAYVEELEEAGIPVFSLGIRQKLPSPRPILRLARIIREWRPHIVHSYMVHANLLARLVRSLARFPILVCSARNVREGNRLRELLYRYAIFILYFDGELKNKFRGNAQKSIEHLKLEEIAKKWLEI